MFAAYFIVVLVDFSNNLVAALGQDVLDAVSDEAFSIAEAYHFALANGFTELPYTEAVENTRERALMRLAQANG